MRQMLKFLKPYYRLLIASTAAIAVSTACDLLLPTIMSDILNRGIYAMDFPYILRCCALMLLVALLGLGTVLLGTWISTKVVSGYCADIRREVFRKVNQMTFEGFGELGTAALVTRATHDVQTVSWIAAELSGTVITIPMLFFGGVILTMRKDLLLALVLLAFLPVILVLVVFIGKKIMPLWDKCDRYIDKQNDIMRQRLRGIRVIRAFNAEGKEHEKVAEATRVMSQTIIQSNISMELVSPVTTLLLNFAALLIVYLGGWRIETGGSLTGGDIFAIVQYIALASSGVIMGAFTIIMLPQARIAASRIGQVLRSEGMADPIAPQDIRLTGDIVFDHVTFSYDGAAEPALQDISFHIPPGKKVAIIGGTGAGKSTALSLLMGFRMPTGGRVLLDGMDTVNLSRHTMRENMRCVLQNTTVYSGTIRENVRMGCQTADDKAIMEALEIAQASEFVESLSEGLDHVIKQSGKNLSGGQKQRLCIARAILKDVPVYLFDDSFSALDFLTESHLRAALGKKIAGRTQIIITQRVTSAMHCDIIYVMEKGALAGVGTHSELLRTCRVYQEIYASQTGGGEAV